MGQGWPGRRVGVAVGAAVLAATLLAGYSAGRRGASLTQPRTTARQEDAGGEAMPRRHTPRLRVPGFSIKDVVPSPSSPRGYAVFVGVNSRPVTPRRDILRATWFPGNKKALAALEEAGVYARFIVGHAPADAQGHAEAVEAGLVAEAAVHGDIFRIPAVESYETLFLKSITYLRTAVAAVDAQYYIKTDDDMYVRLDRIPAVVAQWAADGAGYVGCLNMNGPMEADPASIYYEPLRAMLPKHSDDTHDGDRKWFGYMSGGFYAVSRQAAEWATFRPDSMMRLMSGEDSSLGLQMLSLPVRTVEDRRLCSDHCTKTSIGERCGCLCGVCGWVGGGGGGRGLV